MKLSEILDEWEKDSKIDDVFVDKSALQIPCLHAKYLGYLCVFKKQLRDLNRQKREFSALGKRNSPEYLQHEEELRQTEDAIDGIEKIIHSINQMSYTISTIVKWRVFSQCAHLPDAL